MERTVETIEGDTEGVSFAMPVLRFAGSDDGAPSAYLQAALHAGELPGVVAIHYLMPMLRKAEEEGRIRGAITVVPAANPIGRQQHVLGDLQGRFHVGTRTNFNRGFPLPANLAEAEAAKAETLDHSIDDRLKRRLLGLSWGHDIVLDLHCDDEGVPYFYVPEQLWPAMADVASAMGVEAVVVWDKDTDGTFEGASLSPYLGEPAEIARFDRRAITTVEFRGLSDVYPEYAKRDAEGLYRVLVARGVVEDPSLPKPAPFAGVAAPIAHVEMVQTPVSGAILFEVTPGERVAKGQVLARIVRAPGEEDGAVEVRAPQAGYVLTRVLKRLAKRGDDIVKLVGDGPADRTHFSTLED